MATVCNWLTAILPVGTTSSHDAMGSSRTVVAGRNCRLFGAYIVGTAISSLPASVLKAFDIRLLPREQLDHAPRSVVTEEALVVPSRLPSEGGAARKERPFIGRQCSLCVAGMVAQSVA